MKHYIYLAISGILFGGIVFGAKVLDLMGAGIWEIILIPNILSFFGVLWFVRHDFCKIGRLPFRLTLTLMASMLLVNIGQYVPLFMNTSAALVVLLLYLQPVWTILIDRFYFRRPQGKQTWFLALAMIAGLVILINPLQDKEYQWGGILLALLGGLGISLWVFVTQSISRRKISPAGTFWTATVYTLVPMMIIYALLKDKYPASGVMDFSFELSFRLWGAFIIYTLFTWIIPNILVYANNSDVSATAIGLILLLEPLTGVVLDIVFLNRPLTWNILFGGMVILSANFILVLKPPSGHK